MHACISLEMHTRVEEDEAPRLKPDEFDRFIATLVFRK
jgi:hypothetical protein